MPKASAAPRALPVDIGWSGGRGGGWQPWRLALGSVPRKTRAFRRTEPHLPSPFISALGHGEARACFDAWVAARTGDGLPPVTGFAPHRLPPAVLPRLLLYRLEPDDSLRCTLAGEDMVFLFGFNPTGRTILEMAATAEGRRRETQYRRAIATGMPLWYEGRVLVGQRTGLILTRLALPVLRADAAKGVLLISSFPPLDIARIEAPQHPIDFGVVSEAWAEPEDLRAAT